MELRDTPRFNAVSLIPVAADSGHNGTFSLIQTAYGSMSTLGGLANGYEGFSLSGLTGAAAGYTIAVGESTAANVAKVLATLIAVLARKGVVRASGTGF